MTFVTHSAQETIQLGRRIGSMLRPGAVIAMDGGLAAGKTTITKGIAEALGIADTITSPTFTLISEYEGRLPLYHMDVYRLDSCEDFINLGAEDLIYGNGVSVIEWSERIRDELPPGAISLRLEVRDDGGRDITIGNWPYGEL